MCERLTIAGVPIDPLTTEEAASRVRGLFRDGGQHLIVTPNPEMAVLADRDPAFRKLLENASLALADGYGLKLAAVFQGKRIPVTITGIDFALRLASIAEQEKYSVYFLGSARAETAVRASEHLKKFHPNLRVAGAESGGRIRWIAGAWEEEKDLVQRIAAANPDLLFVALGHGKQERWIRDHLPRLPSVKVAIGIGGAFDVWAGTVRRAPGFMRKLHLEWLWRLFQQPWRFPRIFDATVRFARIALKHRGKQV